MWRDAKGVLNTNAFGEPETFLAPALEVIDSDIESSGPGLVAMIQGMVELIIAELLLVEWDPAEELPFEREWMPDEALADALDLEPGSVADLLAATPPRWRLDLAEVVGDYVDSVLDPDEEDD
jgi:hypothetical protein